MTKPNLSNPRCLFCNGIARKMGIVVYPKAGKIRRYQCTECGKSFSRPIE